MKKSARVSLKVTAALKKDLEDMARERYDRSVNWLAAKYIEQGLQRDATRRKRTDD